MNPDPLDILRRPDPDVAPTAAFTARLRARLAADADGQHGGAASPAEDEPNPQVVAMDIIRHAKDTRSRLNDSRRRLAVLGAIAAAVLLSVLFIAARRDEPRELDVVDSPVTEPTVRPTTSSAAVTSSATITSPTTAASSTAPDEALLGLPVIRSAADAAVTSRATATKPAQVVTGGSSVWVIPDLGPIQRFDASTGELVGTVPLQLDNFPTRPAVAFGSLWMATEWNDQLNRIDLDTGQIIAHITIPGGLRGVGGAIPDGPVAAEDGIWVLSDESGLDRMLVRIDPSTNTIAQTMPAPRGADNLGYGFGTLWVSHVPLQGDFGIYRVDPTTGAVLADIAILGGPFKIRSAFGSMWTSGVEPDPGAVAGSPNGGALFETLNRIDPATNTVVAKIPYAAVAMDWHTDFVEAAGSLWISSKTALLVRIDPTQNRVVDRYLPSTGGGGVATDGQAVWFTGWDDAQLHRLPLG